MSLKRENPALWQLLWQTLGLLMAETKQKFPYKEAKLSKPSTLPDGSEDLSKQWVVEFYVWSEQQEKLIRKRVSLPEPTAKERLHAAQNYIPYFNRLLKLGYVAEAIPPPERPATATETITRHSSLLSALAFFQELKASTIKRQSKRTYKSFYTIFVAYLKDNGLKNVKVKQFDIGMANTYLDWQKMTKEVSNKTRNNHRGYLHTVFEFFISRQILTENPFATIKKLKVKSGNHIPFLPGQVEAVKDHLRDNPDPQLWLFINFIYYTFSRPHEELRLLQIRHIRPRTIIINPDDSKNSHTNAKPIADGLQALINQYNLRSFPPHYYVFGRNGMPGPQERGNNFLYKKHAAMLKAIGFPPGYDLYGWKHTGVIALYMATKDLKLIQLMCGHADISTTDIYLRDLGLFLKDDQLKGFPGL